jgi:hypothetical protein
MKRLRLSYPFPRRATPGAGRQPYGSGRPAIRLWARRLEAKMALRNAYPIHPSYYDRERCSARSLWFPKMGEAAG